MCVNDSRENRGEKKKRSKYCISNTEAGSGLQGDNGIAKSEWRWREGPNTKPGELAVSPSPAQCGIPFQFLRDHPEKE